MIYLLRLRQAGLRLVPLRTSSFLFFYSRFNTYRAPLSLGTSASAGEFFILSSENNMECRLNPSTRCLFCTWEQKLLQKGPAPLSQSLSHTMRFAACMRRERLFFLLTSLLFLPDPVNISVLQLAACAYYSMLSSLFGPSPSLRISLERVSPATGCVHLPLARKHLTDYPTQDTLFTHPPYLTGNTDITTPSDDPILYGFVHLKLPDESHQSQT